MAVINSMMVDSIHPRSFFYQKLRLIQSFFKNHIHVCATDQSHTICQKSNLSRVKELLMTRIFKMTSTSSLTLYHTVLTFNDPG